VPEARLSKAAQEKNLVAVSSVVAAIFLTSMKIVVGVFSGSLGILSEAAHSGLDLVAAVVTLWAVRVASRPADREHTYGHGKFENLSALFETLLLLGTCAWIMYEGIERLLVKHAEIDAGVWSFVVMGTSIVVDVSRSRALARTARKYRSQALEADALHFSTDVWSSAVVIAGLAGVVLARRTGIPWLAKADSAAALVVAANVVWVSIRLGKRSIDALLDAVPTGLQAEVERVAHVPGAVEVRQVRVRRSGPETFVEVTLIVSHHVDLDRTHVIASAAEQAVRETLPGADVVVRVEPTTDGAASPEETVRCLAAQRGMAVHAVTASEQAKGVVVELHVEVAPTKPLGSAHDAVSSLEHAVRDALPEVVEVASHIEPASSGGKPMPAAPDVVGQVAEVVEGVCRAEAHRTRPHSFDVSCLDGRMDLIFHCVMNADTPVLEAHDVAEQLEAALRVRLPELRHVLIHMEPPEGA
jgi:cation diffusion facilitator family transporter